jgi:hypothetical protein
MAAWMRSALQKQKTVKPPASVEQMLLKMPPGEIKKMVSLVRTLIDAQKKKTKRKKKSTTKFQPPTNWNRGVNTGSNFGGQTNTNRTTNFGGQTNTNRTTNFGGRTNNFGGRTNRFPNTNTNPRPTYLAKQLNDRLEKIGQNMIGGTNRPRPTNNRPAADPLGPLLRDIERRNNARLNASNNVFRNST